MKGILFTPLGKKELAEVFSEAFKEQIKEVLSELNDQEEIMKLNEVCDFFGVTRQTIKNWERKSLIQSVQIENRTYFRKADVLELFKKDSQ